MITITAKHIDELLCPTLGATVLHQDQVKRYFKRQLQKLRGAADQMKDQFTKPEEGTLVSNYSFVCLANSKKSTWSDFGKMLAHELNAKLLPHLPISELIDFDDLYLTHYPISDMGVGCHRDTNCKGLVIACVLEGTLPFCTCAGKAMSNPNTIDVFPGEILVMRADKVGILLRPFHFVGKIEKPVLQFGLRQYINPKK